MKGSRLLRKKQRYGSDQSETARVSNSLKAYVLKFSAFGCSVIGIHNHVTFKYSSIKIRSVTLGGDLRESFSVL